MVVAALVIAEHDFRGPRRVELQLIGEILEQEFHQLHQRDTVGSAHA